MCTKVPNLVFDWAFEPPISKKCRSDDNPYFDSILGVSLVSSTIIGMWNYGLRSKQALLSSHTYRSYSIVKFVNRLLRHRVAKTGNH